MEADGLGLRIAEARRASGKTQNQLAHEVKTDSGTISRYERGAITPGSAVLVRISRACGTSVEWLVTGDGISDASSPPSDKLLDADTPASTGTDG